MDKITIRDTVKKINCLLKLDRKIAGVKFLFDKEEFGKAGAKSLTVKMPYCVMVRNAMKGKSLKGTVDNAGCPGGARALGMTIADNRLLSGRHYLNLGLYRDLATAKNVHKTTTYCGHDLYGIMVKPADEYSDEPDVVILVTNPYNGMRLMQAYTYIYGYNTSFRLSGNQAICSECTAFPFESNNINISMLCAGTRNYAKWKDDEMAVGFPSHQLQQITEGLYATMNPVEPNMKKREIEDRFRNINTGIPEIHYNKNYYTKPRTGISSNSDSR